MKWFSDFLDKASEYLAHRKGLLPMIGLIFILLNLLINQVPYLMDVKPDTLVGWLVLTNLFLHVGLAIAILGLMLAWAL